MEETIFFHSLEPGIYLVVFSWFFLALALLSLLLVRYRSITPRSVCMILYQSSVIGSLVLRFIISMQLESTLWSTMTQVEASTQLIPQPLNMMKYTTRL
jgi:hypothetical protein